MTETDYTKGVFTNTENGLEFTLTELKLRGSQYECNPHTDYMPQAIVNDWQSNGLDQELMYNDMRFQYETLRHRLFHPPQTRWFMPLANSPDEQRPICEHWLAECLRNGVIHWTA